MSIFYVLDGIADSVSAVGEGILSLISRPRRLVALAFVLGVLAAASVVLETTIRKLLQSSAAPDPKVVLASLGAEVTALASMRLMLRYLRTDSEPREEPRSIRDRMTIETILRRISKVEEQAAGLSTETRDHVISEIAAEATRKITHDFESELQKKYAPAAEAVGRASRVRETASRMLDRLQTEVRALMRRGNLNLVLGTITTGAAATILAYIALTAKLAGGDWRGYMPTYMLRLSVVVFIEIFAFFFLRLYRASLADIKYFQNEITNLEAKCLALEFTILGSMHFTQGIKNQGVGMLRFTKNLPKYTSTPP